MSVCVKEVRQCHGLTVIHKSGKPVWEQGNSRYLFCCSNVSLNPGVLPPGRTRRKTIPLSDELSEMKKNIRVQHPGAFWSTLGNSYSTKIMLPPNNIYRNMSLAELKKKNLAPKCKYRSEQKVGKYTVEYLNVTTLLLESL